MKIFSCPNCSSLLYFENTMCRNCQSSVGFDFKSSEFVLIDGIISQSTTHTTGFAKCCKNFHISVCNWVTEYQNDTFCKSCNTTQIIPDVNDRDNLEKWKRLEAAKRRLLYQLSRLGLSFHKETDLYPKGLLFNFLSTGNSEGLVTGHNDGVITILLEEADSIEREQIRKQMSEPYRTLIGHFRHEIGHYYWPIIIHQSNIEKYRSIFGDERKDYQQSLEAHYKNGATSDWNHFFISKYASSHSWEDWAETWAHYLHLLDALETAHFSGIGLMNNEKTSYVVCPNPYTLTSFEEILDWGVKLTCAGNSLNRSMGLSDIYPFIIPEPVVKKLNFIHEALSTYTSTT
ncbi:zinc-binding metallopeptidase family protein [Aquimarina sp. M1]